MKINSILFPFFFLRFSTPSQSLKNPCKHHPHSASAEGFFIDFKILLLFPDFFGRIFNIIYRFLAISYSSFGFSIDFLCYSWRIFFDSFTILERFSSHLNVFRWCQRILQGFLSDCWRVGSISRHLWLRLPVEEEAVLVDFEGACRFEIVRIFLLHPRR